jgi:hypothetical protein
MNIFGRKIPDKKDDQPANQTTPGVRMLKEVWDIKTEKKMDRVEGPVSSDIYTRKPREQGIPPRYHGQRVQE